MELQEIANELQKPTSLWPTTVVGWVTFALLIVSTVYNYLKHKEKPFANALKATQDHFNSEVKRLEEHFDREIVRLEERVDETLNGFGERVETFSERMTALETITNGTHDSVIRLLAGKEERDKMQQRIWDGIERARTERIESERRIMDGQQAIMNKLSERGRND